MKDKKGDMEWDTLIPWIIGIGVLVIGLLIAGIISGKMTGAWNFLRNLFRFGG